MSVRFPLAAALLVGVLAAVPAQASHYFLEDSGFLEPGEVSAFQELELRETETLLRGLLTPEQRGAAAFLTGLDPVRIWEIAQICEMIQVVGVGPKVAELLLLAGVQGVADLSSRDAAALLAEIEYVNSVHGIVDSYPGIDHVQSWIAGAAEARYHLRF